MNKVRPSARCLVCGTNLRRLWDVETLARMRVEWNRMMANGICDNCQRDRFQAAIEYERAQDYLRLVLHLGATWKRSRPTRMHPELRYAFWRRRAATNRCVALKMWPAGRPVREGKK